MAKKEKVSADEQFEDQEFNLFEALAALDRKDYGWYDKLSPEQQSKFSPYMLVQWMSTIKGGKDLQSYYLQSTNYNANKFIFNEHVKNHPKLQWMALCAASPGLGKQFHQWIPNISLRVRTLKAPAKFKEINDYHTKLYPKADPETVKELTTAFVDSHKKKMYLSEIYPNYKLADIETLSQLVTDEEIEEYEKERGNR